jgi:hypothetical protein
MANAKGKTEHAGAKNGGGGMWGKRAEVKFASDRRRRQQNRQAILDEIARMSGNDTAASYEDECEETNT